eukprot:12610889-Prorocentrum_lima.AAC.1
MTSSLVGSEMCIRDSERFVWGHGCVGWARTRCGERATWSRSKGTESGIPGSQCWLSLIHI